MTVPSETQCFELLSEVGLAPALVRHSIAVKDFAFALGLKLRERGHDVNLDLIKASALLHDIYKLEADVCHCIEGGQFLREKGFHPVADVIEKHCLNNIGNPDLIPKTTEEKLLLYSDLRNGANGTVTLVERFASIRRRYRLNPDSFERYITFAKQLEDEFRGMIDDVEGLL